MARSTYFDLGRSADACPGSESGYAQRFQCENIVKRPIWTRMIADIVRMIHLSKIPGQAQKQWIVLRYSQSLQNEHPVVAEALRCFASNQCDKAVRAEIEFQSFSEKKASGTYHIQFAEGQEYNGRFVVKARQKFHGVCI